MCVAFPVAADLYTFDKVTINQDLGGEVYAFFGPGPRQRVIDLGAPDPGPLGGGAYTGPLLTRSLLFLGFRGRGDASDLDFRPVADRDLAPRAFSREPVLLAFDKATGETVHSVELGVAPTGTPMTYMLNGTQYIVLAYGTANAAGLVGLALN